MPRAADSGLSHAGAFLPSPIGVNGGGVPRYMQIENAHPLRLRFCSRLTGPGRLGRG
jgi:hypothetical protein